MTTARRRRRGPSLHGIPGKAREGGARGPPGTCAARRARDPGSPPRLPGGSRRPGAEAGRPARPLPLPLPPSPPGRLPAARERPAELRSPPCRLATSYSRSAASSRLWLGGGGGRLTPTWATGRPSAPPPAPDCRRQAPRGLRSDPCGRDGLRWGLGLGLGPGPGPRPRPGPGRLPPAGEAEVSAVRRRARAGGRAASGRGWRGRGEGWEPRPPRRFPAVRFPEALGELVSSSTSGGAGAGAGGVGVRTRD